MNAILSIKPDYCEKIMNGEKKYEFRRRIFGHKDRIDLVFMYSTSPVKKIVGAFSVESILEDRPKMLWEKCKDFSGIEEEDFFRYFKTTKIGFAIKIKKVKSFEPVDPRILFSDFSPPQSFCYIEDEILLTIGLKKDRFIKIL